MMAAVNWAIVLTAVVLAVVCALLGSFLLLRRMVLLGDVISHAVVPGIVLAYLWSGVRELPIMLLGAGGSAIAALLLVQLLQHRFGWSSDAALAAVLSSFFAVGVLSLSSVAAQVDLDVECVLYGELAYVPLDTVLLFGGGVAAPRALLTALGLLVVVVIVLVLGYRRLVLSLFDPECAAVLGIVPRRWQGVLLGLTAVVTVVGFELVGAILIVALLIVPAAAARLLRVSLPVMIGAAALFGAVSAVVGYGLSGAIGGAISGWIALAAGAELGLVLAWHQLRRAWVSEHAPTAPENPLG